MRFTWEDPSLSIRAVADGKYHREIEADRVCFTATHVVFRDNEHAIILAVLATRVHNLQQAPVQTIAARGQVACPNCQVGLLIEDGTYCLNCHWRQR